jgi:hypothetical protein
MLVCLLVHPVAFLLGVLAMMGYGWVAGLPEDNWYGVGIFAVVYLLGYWLLPWWTRPVTVYRYWQQQRQARRIAEQWVPAPEWMKQDSNPIRWPK